MTFERRSALQGAVQDGRPVEVQPHYGKSSKDVDGRSGFFGRLHHSSPYFQMSFVSTRK